MEFRAVQPRKHQLKGASGTVKTEIEKHMDSLFVRLRQRRWRYVDKLNRRGFTKNKPGTERLQLKNSKEGRLQNIVWQPWQPGVEPCCETENVSSKRCSTLQYGSKIQVRRREAWNVTRASSQIKGTDLDRTIAATVGTFTICTLLALAGQQIEIINGMKHAGRSWLIQLKTRFFGHSFSSSQHESVFSQHKMF